MPRLVVRWFQRYARSDETLVRLKAEARDAKRGLWSEENPVAPWIWRKSKKGP